jgi:3-octaprenyl-4-hydroxybenzoate carboxy-lyase
VQEIAQEIVMDMSMSVAPDKQAKQSEAKAVRTGTSSNSSDLDEWLAKVEAMGELKRITAEVDPDLEAATITYLVGSEKSPALLFENIKGHPGHRVLGSSYCRRHAAGCF